MASQLTAGGALERYNKDNINTRALSKYVNDILNLLTLLKSCRYVTKADNFFVVGFMYLSLLLSIFVRPKFGSSIKSLKFQKNWDSHQGVCDSSYTFSTGCNWQEKAWIVSVETKGVVLLNNCKISEKPITNLCIRPAVYPEEPLLVSSNLYELLV